MLSGAAGFFSDDAAEKKTFSNPQKKEDAGKRKRIHSNSYGGSSVGSSSKNEAWGYDRGGNIPIIHDFCGNIWYVRSLFEMSPFPSE